MNIHPFMILSGMDDEDKFYKKFPTEESFFKKYPQARYGYTMDNDGIPTLEESGALGYQTPQQEFTPITNTSSQPQAQQSGGASTTGAIQAVAQGVGNVIDTIGGINRAIQVGGPQLLNALIPDNQNERVRTPQVGYNQYAYGTGSQMMYENGGYLQNETYELTPQEIKRLQELGYEIETL